MPQNDDDLDSLLKLAVSGDQRSLGRLLDEFRPWLRLLAQRVLDERLAGRIDGSDVVQQTYLSAVRRFSEFRGNTTEELSAWLRRIHERNLIDETRKHIVARKRSVSAEVEDVDVDVVAEARFSSPSQRILNGESAVRLARAIGRLPEDQAQAVQLRHLDGWPLDQIASRLDRSQGAVIALLHRGITNLRSLIAEDSY